MATRKKRGNCKKYGRVKSGPRKGLCRMGPATRGKKRKGSTKSKRRANCAKFGFSVLLGRCRKGPARGGRRVSADVAAAMRASMARGRYPVSGGGVDSSVAAAMRAATGRIYGPNF